MDTFQEDIKSWVQLDNEYKKLSDQMKELRSKRNEINEKIQYYVQDENLQSAIIQISDGKLKFQNTKISQPITLKFLKQCLQDFIPDEAQLNAIIDHIKESREVKYSKDIKRTYTD